MHITKMMNRARSLLVLIVFLALVFSPLVAHAQSDNPADAGKAAINAAQQQQVGAECELAKQKFGVPTWYKYLPGQIDPASGECQPAMDFATTGNTVDYNRFDMLLGIGLAAIEILLFFAGIIAVGFIIYGGFQYLTSQGEPEHTRSAKDTILNALIGLVIAMMATTIVRFIATRLTS